MGCEDGRWMELARDNVQWKAFVLAVLNLQVHCIQTGSGAHPASYLMDTKSSFPGGRAARA
jgi:hypothetical protein